MWMYINLLIFLPETLSLVIKGDTSNDFFRMENADPYYIIAMNRLGIYGYLNPIYWLLVTRSPWQYLAVSSIHRVAILQLYLPSTRGWGDSAHDELIECEIMRL